MFTKTLSRPAQDSLAILGKSGLLKDAYLAGGSALALHLGHRYSLDFDFFTSKPFDARQLALKLGRLGGWFLNLQLADPADIGAMKIAAIGKYL